MAVILSLLLSFPVNAYANTDSLFIWENVEKIDDELTITGENDASIETDGYYYWKVTNKSLVDTTNGNWRSGPSGKGSCTLTMNNAFSVTNTSTGTYSSTADISAALGVSIGVSKGYATSYAVKVPKGKKYQILYRAQYKKYKVVQTKYYKIDGYSSSTGKTQTCCVYAFSNWDYTYKSL